tara:strand:+ start:3450 stop:5000 length:1551 start_codon:yes stop_codon:yes gene_type:complete
MADSTIIGGNSLYSGVGVGSLDGAAASSTTNTGALRRKYNFGSYVSELALAQDPFFRFLSMVSKKPTDDPQFKFTEKRSSYTKRYAYMAAYSEAGIAVPATNPDSGDTSALATAGSSVYSFKFHTDYNSQGNLQNIVGKTNKYYAGVTGTQPAFFMPGQIIKVPKAPGSADFTAAAMDDYTLWKINSVNLDTANYAIVNATCVKGTAAVFRMPDGADVTGSAVVSKAQEDLEPFKCTVVGTAFDVGSGYPETWNDQPYSTSHGQTQIFKTSAVMNNTDRATVLKYEGNEWARIWKEKLIEHKFDIESALLFGSQATTGGVNTTQGAVDFISTYGNAFSLTHATKSQDSFLEDLSAMLDPRYNNAGSTVFFCDTPTYNWLHKLSGYFANNLGSVQGGGGLTVPTSNLDSSKSMMRADFAVMGKKKVFGVDVTTISTIYGDMNVARNVHLDGTDVKMLGINMKYCSYRPLVGNGINRDTSVYVGVQTLENSGVDRRVDQILTEAGMEWCCPETHAIWS